MESLLSALCMILCNKVPKNVVPFRTDSLAAKIKMVNPPKSVELRRRTVMEKHGEEMKEVVIEPNTNVRAIIRLLVPRRVMTHSEMHGSVRGEDDVANEPAGEGEKAGNISANQSINQNDTLDPPAGQRSSRGHNSRLSQRSEKIIEQDQDEKALLINAKVNLREPDVPYMVLQMNEFAAKEHRRDFVEYFRSKIPEYFDADKEAQQKIQQMADEEADKIECDYIDATTNEYDVPLFKYNVHALDHE